MSNFRSPGIFFTVTGATMDDLSTAAFDKMTAFVGDRIAPEKVHVAVESIRELLDYSGDLVQPYDPPRYEASVVASLQADVVARHLEQSDGIRA